MFGVALHPGIRDTNDGSARYLAVAAIFFLAEVMIARGALPGPFVRNSLGDVLVIPLLHFTLRGLTGLPPWHALAVILTGFVVEALQSVHLADLLGLQPGSLPSVILGTTFSAADLLMYCIGAVLAA